MTSRRGLPGRGSQLLATLLWLLPAASGKWVEGTISTKENWAFVSRFCFLSLEGQFEYLLEYDKEQGTPNLLLYYDDASQWPAVYHSSKSCSEREAVLNKAGQNQVIRLSHWYPDTEYSGCILTRANKELPAQKSTTPQPVKKTPKLKTNTTTVPPHPSFYDQFLKTTKSTTPTSTNTNSSNNQNSTTWYELLPTDEWNSTTMLPEDELWESIGPGHNGSKLENLKDVEILFDEKQHGGHKIKRSTSERELIQRYRRRRLNSESSQSGSSRREDSTERLVVSCHNSRRFRSARERWWFIAVSNCDSNKGLEIKYKFLMTNGPDGDFWHQHFSADEFYVLPVLLAYTLAYVIVLIAVVVCSVELRSRHLLHSTYKLFLVSATLQHAGVLLQSLAYIRYAADGHGGHAAKVTGQFLSGMAEMSFVLLLVLLGKGYTVTRGRLKLGFTVRLTVFACAYLATYVVLFIYQAKAFDPGEVLYLYESPAGYGVMVLRVAAWAVFAYSTFFTVRKYPEKNMFYAPFFICGTLWFYAGPLFILTANSYIDKWVRESVVTAVLLFITFSGHIMFLLLTLPVFANKNFPYHVRTTQIGVMEVTNNSALDGFGPNAYHPTAGAAQTVIIPLTRRTEELIGNMYREYMASAPPAPAPLSPAGALRAVSPRARLLQQASTDTNHSDDIKPTLDKEIFTVESQISKIEANKNKLIIPTEPKLTPSRPVKNLPVEKNYLPNGRNEDVIENDRSDLPSVLRSRRNLLEPIKRDVPVPSWSLAKGPCVVSMMRKAREDNGSVDPLSAPHKVPPGRAGLPPSGDMSTIVEGREHCYVPSDATANLFTAAALRNGGNT